jgi:hypothetical protein
MTVPAMIPKSSENITSLVISANAIAITGGKTDQIPTSTLSITTPFSNGNTTIVYSVKVDLSIQKKLEL